MANFTRPDNILRVLTLNTWYVPPLEERARERLGRTWISTSFFTPASWASWAAPPELPGAPDAGPGVSVRGSLGLHASKKERQR